MAMNKLFISVLLLLWALSTHAQNRYVVFLADKNNNEHSISDPSTFLSDRAVLKRDKYNIPITMQDIPVTSIYLDQIESYEVEMLFTSKWINAVFIESEESVADQLLALPFVVKIELIAPGPTQPGMAPETEETINGTSGRKELNDVHVQSMSVNALQNRMLGADEMHERGFTGENMLIAVFDSGFETVDDSYFYDHVFDNNRITATRDFIRKSGNVFQHDGHGTKVLSTIAAYSEDEFTGIAHNANFVLCVTEDVKSEHRIEEYNWLAAAEFADSLGVDVISSSVAYTTFDPPSYSYSYEDMNGQTAIVSNAARIAAQKGIIVVTSAGNDGNKSWKYINAPSDADTVLAIGSVSPTIERSFFSSFGPTSDGRIKPDLVALGSGVSVVYGENTTFSNGTSFAAPQIAGLSAGFWQAFPELSSWEIVNYLKASASNSTAPDTAIGFGLPNFNSAFELASDSENDIVKEFTVYPNPVDGSRIFVASAGKFEIGDLIIKFYDGKGAQIKLFQTTIFSEYETIEVDVSDLGPGYYFLIFESPGHTEKSKLIVR